MGSEETQRRAYPRVDKLYFVAYVNREGEEQRTPVSMGRTVNISMVGIGIEVYQRLAVDSIMEMEIAMDEGRLFSLKGTVVHITAMEEGKFFAGIKFDQVQAGLGAPPV